MGIRNADYHYYADEVKETEIKDSENEYRCLIGNLNRVREGHTFVYSVKSQGCSGGKRYAGFKHSLRRYFEYFLSYGIPGEIAQNAQKIHIQKETVCGGKPRSIGRIRKWRK